MPNGQSREQMMIARMRRAMTMPVSTPVPSAPSELMAYNPFERQQQIEKEIGAATIGQYGWYPTNPEPWAVSAPGAEKIGTLPPPKRAPLPEGLDPAALRLEPPGYTKVAEGVEQIATGAAMLPKDKLAGAGEISRGLMHGGTPFILPAAIIAPGPAVASMIVGTGVGEGGRRVATAFGADPRTAQDIGDISALLSGVFTGAYAGVRQFGNARAAAELSRSADALMAKVPEAAPPQAAALRAQAGALIRSAQDLAPRQVPATVLPPEVKEPGLLPMRKAQATAPPPGSLSSEAGVLSLPTPQEISASRQWLKTKAFDEYTPIGELVKKGVLAMEDNPYIGARMYAGHYGKIWDAHRRLRDIAKPVNDAKLLPQYEKLLELNRDIELFNRPDIVEYKSPRAKDITDATAQRDALLNSLTPDQLNLLNIKAQEFYQFHRANLRNYADSGMTSPEAEAAILANNEYYAPFHHITHLKTENIPSGGKSLEVKRQRAVYKIEGAESATAPVLESTLRNVHRMVADADRNRVMRQIADLSRRTDRAGVPEWGGAVRPLQPGEKLPASEAVIDVWELGKKNQYVVPKAVKESVQGMNPRDPGVLQKVLNFTNEAVRNGATMYYLPFLAKNAIRDYRTALLRSPIGFSPIDWAYGFAKSIKRDGDFAAYMRSGAAQSGFFERDVKLSKEVKHITESTAMRVARHLPPWRIMRLVAETVELAPRVGIYERARAAGLSDVQAAWLGRNVTQDFSSIGTAMRLWNSATPFVNARLHGAANIFAAVRDNPARAALVLGSTTLLPTVYLHYHNQLMFPDILKQISPEVRDQNYLLIYGDAKDRDGNFTQVIKVPKVDYDRYFGNPVENFLNHLHDTNPKSWWQSLYEFTSDVSPASFIRQGQFSPERFAGEALPPAVGAALELARNRDLYTGYPIEPERVKDADSWEQWGQTPATLELEKTPTGRGLIALAKILKVGSPPQYRHLMRRLGAGAGRLLTAPPEEDTGTAYAASAAGKEALINMFVGARGGAAEQKLLQEMAPYRTAAGNEEAIKLRNKTRVTVAAREAPQGQQIPVVLDAIQKYMQGDPEGIDPQTGVGLMKMFAAQTVGMTPAQLGIYAFPQHAKALYLVDKQKEMDPVEFNKMLQTFIQANYIDAGVIRDMMKTIGDNMMREYRTSGRAVPPEVSKAIEQAAAPPPAAAAPQESTLADKNNNPLNLRGADQQFLKFSTPEEGWKAAKADLSSKMGGTSRVIKPGDTLQRLIEVWAPASEKGNDPEAYAEYVATRLHVPLTTPIKDLADRVDDLAQVMSEVEGWNGGATAAANSKIADALRRAMKGVR